jgi:hypothetical protein
MVKRLAGLLGVEKGSRSAVPLVDEWAGKWEDYLVVYWERRMVD